jgi:hypothetical protein
MLKNVCVNTWPLERKDVRQNQQRANAIWELTLPLFDLGPVNAIYAPALSPGGEGCKAEV